MEYSLKFLYQRIKNPKLTREEAESKVCQEILVAKIGNSSNFGSKVSFKGGLIIDSLVDGKRGYTKDIDFDFIKYPLSKEGLDSFFECLSTSKPYENISIKVEETTELRHKNYQGRRVFLSFNDKEINYHLTVDIGIFVPLIKQSVKYEYNVAFGGKSQLNISPIERIIAEKLSTFAIYLTDNTRIKDLFDAYYLLTNIIHKKDIVMKMLKKILVSKNHYYKNMAFALASIKNTLTDKRYFELIRNDKKNWTGVDPKIVVEKVIHYLFE